MKFSDYIIVEVKWQRRQLRKGKPYWIYDKYEITKEGGEFKLVDVSQMVNNEPKEIGRFDTLNKAKGSVAMSEAVGRYNIGFEEMAKFYQTASPMQIKRMEKIVKAEDWRKFKALIKDVLGVELH